MMCGYKGGAVNGKTQTIRRWNGSQTRGRKMGRSTALSYVLLFGGAMAYRNAGKTPSPLISFLIALRGSRVRASRSGI